MRVALVHDWLTGMRGGEKCLEVLCELFPGADVFTLFHQPGSVSKQIEGHRILTSGLQRLPGSARWYRYLLPLMPSAIEAFDLTDYDLVISSSHCVAKGVIARPDAVHISYVHSPMRYIWDLRPQYFPSRGLLGRFLLPPLLSYLRLWDVSSAARVDHFISNSAFVARRIEKYYRREAQVIHPPVDVAFFGAGVDPMPQRPPAERPYLMVSAPVPSKGIELAIEAFAELGRPLEIVGSGPLQRKLERSAPAHVRFRGWLSNEELRQAYAGCRALVHTAVEDFGIVPLEAAAAGKPSIALGRAGSLETIVGLEWSGAPQQVPEHMGVSAAERRRAPTGVLFAERSASALIQAVHTFEQNEERFEAHVLRARARRFDRSRYARAIGDAVQKALGDAQVAGTPRAPAGAGFDDVPLADFASRDAAGGLPGSTMRATADQSGAPERSGTVRLAKEDSC